jgi:hypothetical protein
MADIGRDLRGAIRARPRKTERDKSRLEMVGTQMHEQYISDLQELRWKAETPFADRCCTSVH